MKTEEMEDILKALKTHAGKVEPGMMRYEVTETHDHRTLKSGDVVVMVETPKFANLLLRVTDLTLHFPEGVDEQYVHLRMISETVFTTTG